MTCQLLPQRINQADGWEISQLPRGPLNTLLRMAQPPHLEYSAVQNFLTDGRGQLSIFFFTEDVEGHALNPSQ